MSDRLDKAAEKAYLAIKEVNKIYFRENILPVIRKNGWEFDWGMGGVSFHKANGQEVVGKRVLALEEAAVEFAKKHPLMAREKFALFDIILDATGKVDGRMAPKDFDAKEQTMEYGM